MLVIEDRVPHECFGAGYPRSREIIKEIAAAGSTVSLFPIFHHPENWTEVRRTVGRTVEVALGHSGKTLGAFLASRAGFYDAILICRPHNMSVFLDAVEQHPGALGSAKLIYDAEALFSEREFSGANCCKTQSRKTKPTDLSPRRSGWPGTRMRSPLFLQRRPSCSGARASAMCACWAIPATLLPRQRASRSALISCLWAR